MKNDTDGARRAPFARTRRPQLAGVVLASSMLFGFGGLDLRPPALGEITVTRYADGDDLLTAGLGRSGLALPIRLRRLRPSCAGAQSMPTTGRWSTPPPTAATAACSDRISTSTATTPWARA
jgi:hypothetical protein